MTLKENFSIFSKLSYPDILTMFNLACGVTAIFFILSNEYLIACLLIIAAAFFDFLDGKLARYLKKSSVFGMEMDSLCDLVSFGVAPAVLAFKVTPATAQGWIFAVGIYVVFVIAGMLRLARYNTSKNLNYFEGVPITFNGIIVPVVFFLGLVAWFPLVFLVMSIFMISSFHIDRLW
jgi:CDP-diacylglycerol--serine O-phosphatidyltransferase